MPPEQVIAPQNRWEMDQVIYSGGPGPGRHAIAIGLWDGRPSLVMRWNGGDERPKGNPVSTGHPTWFVIPHEYHRAIIGELILTDDVLRRCRAFLSLE